MVTLLYIHLHKSGGTTANHALDKLFKGKRIYQIDGNVYERSSLTFKELPEDERNQFSLIKGHQFYGLHRSISNSYKYFTILREPISRLISLYNYCRIAEEIVFRQDILEGQLDFYQFIESGLSRTADNGMTRFISGVDWNMVPYGHCNTEMFELAKKNIEADFVLTGLSEDFDNTLLLLKILMRYSGFPMYEPRNVTDRRNNQHIKLFNIDEIIATELLKLEKYYKYDLALYHYASEKYSQVKAKYANRLRIEKNKWIVYKNLRRMLGLIN